MRVLVIEDDTLLRESLHTLLVGKGYACDTAADGIDGLHCATEYPVDLAVVDLGLPEKSGVDVIQAVRAQGLMYPILILTARDDWQDKVKGLEAGADDYLTKPFNNEELLARLNALLRRSKGFAEPVITISGVTLDTAAKTASIEGALLSLTAFEYRLLECLMLNVGKVMSKTVLTEHIYDEDSERDSNVIEVLLGRLRRKIKAQTSTVDHASCIETIRGQGYRFVADKS